jgi:hypothetical protein
MLFLVRLWMDLVGADGMELSMELGVLGEDCEDMDVIWAQELMDGD